MLEEALASLLMAFLIVIAAITGGLIGLVFFILRERLVSGQRRPDVAPSERRDAEASR